MDEPVEVIRARSDALVRADRLLMQELIALRNARPLSQEVIGDRMGVSQSAVSQFERYDSNPTLSSIRRYALAIGARVEHRVFDDSRNFYVQARPDQVPCFAARLETAKTPILWGSSRTRVLEDA